MVYLALKSKWGVNTMDVNINSPVYYKDLYGIDNAVYRFTQRAYLFFKELGVAYERKEKSR